MGLIEASPDGFNLAGIFDLPDGQGPAWTHPVISDRKLFLRWNDKLLIYDIANKTNPDKRNGESDEGKLSPSA